MSKFIDVVGENALSASLATLTKVVQVFTLPGGVPAYTGSYYTGFASGSIAGQPESSSVIIPDSRAFRIFTND